MDISTPLIFVTLFLVACLSLFLVYKFGIKEKSYEEALAEQRQQNNALLGVKPKPKEKKSKKAAKKSKEKPSHQENETDDSENVDAVSIENSQLSHKLHVEFKEEPEEVPIKEVEEVKRDDIYKQEPVREKLVKEKKQNLEETPQAVKNVKKSKQSPTNNDSESLPVVEKESEEIIVESVTVLPPTNGVVGNPGKEKKKKKSEFNTRQQLTAERDGLINSVRKAELSKTEVQLLIDLLLNKQLEAPAVIGDWSEGKSDPVQKLKKQLAEKEKALAEEQEALLGVQAKLKEIRTEQQAEKSQLQQKIRGLEEIIQAKQIEAQATNNRLQVNTQNLQQLQAELNAEILKTHKLLDDNAALQMQTQQFEVRISQLQETDAKYRSDVEELSAQNQRLRLELQQNQQDQQQQFLIQLTNVENGLKLQIQQMEESHQELERSLELALRQENDWKIEISNLNSALQQQFEEKRRLEHATEQLKEELCVSNNENTDSAKNIAQLNSELQQLKEQISQVNSASKETKAQENEMLNLTNELSSVRNELSSVKSVLQQTAKRYEIELESSVTNYNKIQLELEEQKAKNNELRTKNWKVVEALNAAESRSKANKQTDINLDKLTNEIRTKEQDSQKQFIQRLFPDIEDLQAVTSEDWQAEFGRLIKNYISNLKKEHETPSSPKKTNDVSELQAQIQHYKTIIDDTEGMFYKLQLHIEKEEINWRNEFAAKEAEIESLKDTLLLLQTKLLSSEKQLSQEINEKQRISQECQLLKTQSSTAPDASVTIEKLSEEINRLREQLRVEQTKNEDVNVCIKGQSSYNSNSTNGAALIEGTGN